MEVTATALAAAVVPTTMIPRVVLLDGDDSYSHNLVGLIADAFAQAHSEVDERIVVLRVRDYSYDELVRLLPHFGVLVLGPGPGSPSSLEETHPARVFAQLLAHPPQTPPLPTLGVCLGHQALAASTGLNIIPAPNVAHGVVRRVEPVLDTGGQGFGIWKGSEAGCDVVTYNSLTVDPTRLSSRPSSPSTSSHASPCSNEMDCTPNVRVTAWMGSGSERAVMALQHTTLPFHSVQFHPESVCSSGGAKLLHSFFTIASSSERLQRHPELYDPLPPSILSLSRIRRQTVPRLRLSTPASPMIPTPPHHRPRVENQGMPFQLRVKVLEHVKVSPKAMFEHLVKDASALGDVWLDSASANSLATPNKKRSGQHFLPNCDGAGGGDDDDGSQQLASSDLRGRYSFMGSADLVVSYFGSKRMIHIQKEASALNEPHHIATQIAPRGCFGWCDQVMNQFRRELGHTVYESSVALHGSTSPPLVSSATMAQMQTDPICENASHDEDDQSDLNRGKQPLKARWNAEGSGSSSAHTWAQHLEAELAPGLVRDPSTSSSSSCEPATFLAVPPGPVGLLGYIGYDVLSETLPNAPQRTGTSEAGRPDAQLSFCNTMLTYDHLMDKWWVTGLVLSGTDDDHDSANLHHQGKGNIHHEDGSTSPTLSTTMTADAPSNAAALLGHDIGLTKQEWFDKIARIHEAVVELHRRYDIHTETAAQQNEFMSSLEQQHQHSPVVGQFDDARVLERPLEFTPAFGHEEYLDLIHKAQDEIRAGESYEICLTMPFTTRMDRVSPSTPPPPSLPYTQPAFVNSDFGGGQEPAAQPPSLWATDQNYALYLKLRKRNAAPYGAYLRFSPFDVSVLASSPERFVKVSRMGRVEMKPIKGTAKRNLACEEDDAEIAHRLRNDIKERAENLMIADLVRHDLVAICEPGSLEVSALMKIETMATVHQLVSTVVGRLKEGVSAVEAVQTTFPPGSMTGAPKLRSVQILDGLEGERGRGVYSGTLGYWAVDGSADFSVIIRTAVVRGDHVTLGGGGAITILSDAEQEWQEVQTKVAAVTAALNTVI